MFYLADTGALEWNDSASISDGDFKGQLSLTAVLCEWICTFLIVLFAVSMVPEFRLIEIYRPVVLVKAYQKALNGELKETSTVPEREGNEEDEADEGCRGQQPNDTSSEPLMQLP